LILFVQNQNLASLPPAQQICISRALLSGPFWGVYDQVKTPRHFPMGNLTHGLTRKPLKFKLSNNNKKKNQEK
jgi:hypothetical protein